MLNPHCFSKSALLIGMVSHIQGLSTGIEMILKVRISYRIAILLLNATVIHLITWPPRRKSAFIQAQVPERLVPESDD